MLADFAVAVSASASISTAAFASSSWLMSYDDNAGDVYFAIS